MSADEMPRTTLRHRRRDRGMVGLGCLLILAGAIAEADPPPPEDAAQRTAELLETLEQEHDPSIQRGLALEVLRLQLEPDKPTWPARDRGDCAPLPDLAPVRLPYVKLEVERLLRRPILCWLRLVGWGSNLELREPFREWGRHLSLSAQRTFWRSVLDALEGPTGAKDKVWEFAAHELAWSLMLLADETIVSDPAAARPFIEEARELVEREKFDDVGMLLDRIQLRSARVHDATTAAWQPVHDPAVLVGVYMYGWGFGGGRTRLGSGGTFLSETWIDVESPCRERLSAGVWRLERGRVVFSGPEEPPKANAWIQQRAPRFAGTPLLPVRWGERMYILSVEDTSIQRFCNAVNAGRSHISEVAGGMVRGGELPVTGLPELPPVFADLLLPGPIEVQVLGEIGARDVVALGGYRAGLRPLMYLYAPDDGSPWEVRYVMDDLAFLTQLGRPPGNCVTPSHLCSVAPGVGSQ